MNYISVKLLLAPSSPPKKGKGTRNLSLRCGSTTLLSQHNHYDVPLTLRSALVCLINVYHHPVTVISNGCYLGFSFPICNQAPLVLTSSDPNTASQKLYFRSGKSLLSWNRLIMLWKMNLMSGEWKPWASINSWILGNRGKTKRNSLCTRY